MTTVLPETIALGRVGLAVADLDRSIRFYEAALGMTLHGRGEHAARLGAGDGELLWLEERRGAVRDPAAAGLFHVAYRVPDRGALGAALRHLRATGTKLAGASDHDVSEALYLDDPDGHGIEIYRDRPREDWFQDGRFRMGTKPMDVAGVLAAADGPVPAPGTVVGHVHLETHDLAAARGFYESGLGMAVMGERPGAVFLSKGGYHHHVALNVWNRRSRPQALEEGALGLLFYEIAAAGTAASLVDPSGIEVRLLA